MAFYVRKSILSGLFILLVVAVRGQTLELLQTRLNTAQTDTTRLRLYCQLVDSLYAKDQFDSLYSMIRQALPIALRLHSKPHLAKLYYRLGLVYRNKGLFEKSILYMKQAKALYTQLDDPENRSKVLYALSVVTFDKGDYKTGIALSLASLNYFKQNNFTESECHIYQLLASMYSDLKNDKLKRFYTDKFLQLARQRNNLEERILAYDMKAESYEDHGDYQQALPYRKQALQLTRIYNQPAIISAQLNSVALNLRKQNRLDAALRYLQEALQISKQIHDNGMQGQTLQEMSLNQLQRGNHAQALSLAQEGMSSIQLIKWPKAYADALGNLAAVQETTGQYQQALTTYKNYYAVKDSLFSAEKTEKIAQIQARFDLDNKEKTILLLTRNAQLQQLKARQQEERLTNARQRELTLAVGSGLLIILAGVISYFLYQSRSTQKLLARQKQEIELQADQLKESNSMKDKLFSIVSHDLRGPIASLKASFSFLKISERVDAWEAMEQEVHTMSQTLDNTLYWSLSQRNGIQARLQDFPLSDLVYDTLESFTGLIRYKNLITTFDDSSADVCMDENLTSLVLRNILHNAIKFTPSGGTISLAIKETPATTELSVTDTGVGMDMDKAPSQQQGAGRGTGLGLTLSEELMKRNGGQLLVKSQVGQGTTVTLSWPKT